MTTSVLTLPEQALRGQLADEPRTIDLIASLYGDTERVEAIGQLIYEWCKSGRMVARRVESSHLMPILCASFKVGGGGPLRMPKPTTHSTTDFHIQPEDYAKALQNGLADLLPETPPAVLAWLGSGASHAQGCGSVPDILGLDGEVPVTLAKLLLVMEPAWHGMATDIKKKSTNGLKAAAWRNGMYYPSACRAWVRERDAEFEATGRGKRRWVEPPKAPHRLVMTGKG